MTPARWLLSFLLIFAATPALRAEEAIPKDSPAGESEADDAGSGEEDEEPPPPPMPKAMRGRAGPQSVVDSHTGAEGTRALDRFHAQPAKRSVYQLNGEPLEIDSD